jgi:hypothetical protein
MFSKNMVCPPSKGDEVDHAGTRYLVIKRCWNVPEQQINDATADVTLKVIT